MKINIATIVSALLVSLVSVLAARSSGGGGGSRGSSYSSSSGGSSFSRPGPSPTYKSPTGPSPTYKSPSSSTNRQPSSTNNAPSSGGGQYGQTNSKDVSYNNPNPVYKPQTPAGAPTMAGGGGGYNYNTQPRAPTGYSKGALVGAAVGGAAGAYLLSSFLYGGMYSSPSCRGGYDYSGYCNRGTASANHQCPQQIPLCPIPQTIRDSWYIGSTTNIEVIADKSTCSSSAPNLGPDTPNTFPPTPTPVDVFDDDNTTAAEALSNNGTTIPEVDIFTLADCTDAVVTSGTCASSRFTYDELSGKCKCCDAGSDLTPWEFTSAVYVYSSSNPFETYGAPTSCVSGSTMFYPKQDTTVTTSTPDASVSGGGAFVDTQYSCVCGDCNECGDPKVSYLDWNGPFVVPDELGLTATSSVSDKNLYDPVDTCTCNVGGSQCAAQYQQASSGSDGNTSSASWLLIASLLSSLVVHYFM